MTVTFFEDVGTMATRDHKIIIWIIWLLIRLICKSTEGRGLGFIENLDFFQIKVGRESPFWNFAWDKMQENARITDFLKCFYFLFLFFYGQRKQNGRYLGIKISRHSVTKANVCIRSNMEKNRWNICDIWALACAWTWEVIAREHSSSLPPQLKLPLRPYMCNIQSWKRILFFDALKLFLEIIEATVKKTDPDY